MSNLGISDRAKHDAELLALAGELADLSPHLDNDNHDEAAADRAVELVELAIDFQATSLAALQAKATLLAWELKHFGRLDSCPGDRLAGSLACDLAGEAAFPTGF